MTSGPGATRQSLHPQAWVADSCTNMHISSAPSGRVCMSYGRSSAVDAFCVPCLLVMAVCGQVRVIDIINVWTHMVKSWESRAWWPVLDVLGAPLKMDVCRHMIFYFFLLICYILNEHVLEQSKNNHPKSNCSYNHYLLKVFAYCDYLAS